MSRVCHKQEKLASSQWIEPLEGRRLMSAVPLAVPALTAKQLFDVPIAEIGGLPAGAAAPTAVIRWGGGAISVVQATPLSGSPGQFVAWAPHTYRRAGTRVVSVAFRDHGKMLGRVHERVTVGKQSVTPSTPSHGGPPPLASDHQPGVTAPAVTGAQWEGVLGAVSFPNPPSGTVDLSYAQVRIEWGDGTFSPGQLTGIGSNEFQVTGAHVYASPGTYAVHVTANYEGYPLMPIPGQPVPEYAIYLSEYAGLDATLQVSGAPTMLPPPSVQITGQTLPTAYAAHFNGTLATMTGISPDPLAPYVYAVVDWGNGSAPSADNAWVQYQDGQYVVTGNFGFPNFGNTGAADHSGSYDVTVKLMLNDHDDPTKNTVLGSVTDHLATLPNSPQGVTLHLSAGQTFSGSLGTVTLDPTRAFESPAIYWGDFPTADTAVTLTPIGNDQFEVTASHTYAASGQYVISLSGDYVVAQSGSTNPANYFASDLLVSTAIVL